jgi:hypothetical protein
MGVKYKEYKMSKKQFSVVCNGCICNDLKIKSKVSIKNVLFLMNKNGKIKQINIKDKK